MRSSSAWPASRSSRPWRCRLPKLPVLSGRDVRRVLESHGFQLVRQRGSHMVMQRSLEDGTITVPVPDHDELRAGTLRSIIRQSGLAVEDFRK
ncbi:MAG TPA: type II toxin-antitoxin system HicA family toxin [Luteolibacter sp.]|nr:type II toxin-antitoxin system HicA family toxin [Luteolibacter sp.]